MKRGTSPKGLLIGQALRCDPEASLLLLELKASFEELDSEETGMVSVENLREALAECEMPEADAEEMLCAASLGNDYWRRCSPPAPDGISFAEFAWVQTGR